VGIQTHLDVAQDGPHNQIESNTAIEGEVVESGLPQSVCCGAGLSRRILPGSIDPVFELGHVHEAAFKEVVWDGRKVTIGRKTSRIFPSLETLDVMVITTLPSFFCVVSTKDGLLHFRISTYPVVSSCAAPTAVPTLL
jgi:hypothetical protein